MRITGGAASGSAAILTLLLTVSGCSGSTVDASNEQPPASSEVGAATGAPEALLSPGDQPSFTRLDDRAYSVVAGVSPDGCVSVALDDGRVVLLYAPYGSSVSMSSPHIRLTEGYAGFDVGDRVHISGWVKDVWKAAGPSAPADWRQCVGGRGDHEPMLVAAANDA